MQEFLGQHEQQSSRQAEDDWFDTPAAWVEVSYVSQF